MKQPLSISEIKKLVNRLFPLMRSITGSGLTETYEILSEIVKFDVITFKSGSKGL